MKKDRLLTLYNKTDMMTMFANFRTYVAGMACLLLLACSNKNEQARQLLPVSVKSMADTIVDNIVQQEDTAKNASIKFIPPVIDIPPVEDSDPPEIIICSDCPDVTIEPIEKPVKPKVDTSDVWADYETMPVFPGGEEKLMEFVRNSMRYPEAALKKGEQGRVVVRFVVTKTGSIKDVTVISGVSPDLDKEAVRIVESVPRWTPGEFKGVPVDVYCNLPIIFKLPDD